MIRSPVSDLTITFSSCQVPDVKADTDSYMSGYQNTLTFTAANYSIAQRVWVTAVHDKIDNTPNRRSCSTCI